MIEINKQGNAIRIDFTDNDKYLFNGTMEVASNELMLVVDESDMITFKRTTNGDVLFSQTVDNIKISGSAVTKDNVIEQFATIGYSQSGGGGGETGAVTSVNGQTGEVVLTASSLNAYTKTQTDDLINGVRTIANDANSKADAVTSRVQDVETSLGNKQDTLVSGVNIKTVNGQSIVGEGDVVIEGTDSYTKTESDAKYATKSDLNSKADISTVEALSTEVAANRTATTALTSKVNEDSEKIASLDTEMDNKANSADVPTNTQFNSLAGEVANKADKTSVYTKQEVDNKVASKQDTLTAGNGITITKSENKTIISSTSPTVQTGETGTADNYIYSSGSGNKNVISQIETNSDVDDTLKNPNYVPIKVTGWNGQGATSASTRILGATGDRAGVMSAADKTKLDGIDMTTKQDKLTSGENIKTINGESILGSGNLVIESADAYTKAEADEKFATNTQVTELTSNVRTLQTDKQDKLVSGTNIKTINGDSILGNGNLVIQSGTSNWDDIQGKPQFAEVATSGDYNDLINKPAIPDVSGLATKEEIADMETKSNAAATYATKEEIPSLEGYLTETAASETYATKQELGNKLDTATYNSEKAGFETKENAAATYQVKGDYATKSEMTGKQDTLVSGTNIKTINGKSILGEGNIKITSGSKAWYFIGATAFLTGEQTNAGINVVGGTISYDQVSVGDTVVLDRDYYFTVLNKFVDTSGNHISILPLYNASTGNGTSIISYIITLQSSSSADAQIDKANIPISTVWTAKANKNIRVDTNTNGAITLSGWTGYNAAKPGDVVNITYSNYNWNLVVTGRYKDNNGTYLSLSGLGDKYTGYRINKNIMDSYVPFDKNMDSAVVIGRDAGSFGGTKYEVAIGAGAATNGTNAVAIGAYGATANANATAVGSGASANEEGTTVIGANLKANKQDGSTIEKVLVGYYDAANSTSVPVLAYNETDGARIKSGSSLKKIATDDQLPSSEALQKLNSLPNFVTLTKAEYDALGTKDQNTYYFIKEA